eukprot:CAMPEP_0114274298 /NCGR_PEP_ID=MMETSP0058-20121206/29663_1 /TAXON_ID=36894 /ORGANISM="Pyramimonas parkeae, CCMP726" /LENGTH=194 /DNA_ID=CAMNT_0001394025 /DNA_START=181 /DNA_END=761 /DNA_ORIENTATION=-
MAGMEPDQSRQTSRDGVRELRRIRQHYNAATRTPVRGLGPPERLGLSRLVTRYTLDNMRADDEELRRARAAAATPAPRNDVHAAPGPSGVFLEGLPSVEGARPQPQLLPWGYDTSGWTTRPNSAASRLRVTLLQPQTDVALEHISGFQRRERMRIAAQDRRVPFSWQERLWAAPPPAARPTTTPCPPRFALAAS